MLMTILKEMLDILFLDALKSGYGVLMQKRFKAFQVGLIRLNSIFRQAALNREVGEELLAQLGYGLRIQKWHKENVLALTRTLYTNRLTAIFHPVKLTKLTECFSSLATFFYTGFFVKFPSLQLTLDSINLEFLFQLTNRVFKVAFHFYFDHEQSHPLSVHGLG